jgi:GTPase SAR1 family protein
MMPELSQQQTAKLVLLGEMGSGKSSLVLRYVKGQFFDYQVRARLEGRPPAPPPRRPARRAGIGRRRAAKIFRASSAPRASQYEVGPSPRRAAPAGVHRGRRVPHKDHPGAERQV